MAQSYKLDDQVGYLLRLANQKHGVIFQQVITHDLTPTQFSTLLRIAEHTEVSQNQLGRLTAIDIATIKGVVDRLREKQLIVSRADPDDKRRSLISLSKAGQSLVSELKKEGNKISKKTMQALSKSEQQTLVDLLRRIC